MEAAPPTQRLGVFGGTFDPPHIGHLILAAEAHHQLALERVLWVLTPNPPHKGGRANAPLEARLAMVQAALANDATFELSWVDIQRPPPHYAVDTMHLLRQQYPQATLVYLMGGDSLVELHTWHNPLGFVAACDEIGVLERPGWRFDLAQIEQQVPGVSAKVRLARAPLLEIASSEIRHRVALGLPYRYFLPSAVYEVIERWGLYRGG